MIGALIGIALIGLGVLFFRRKTKNTVYGNSKIIGRL